MPQVATIDGLAGKAVGVVVPICAPAALLTVPVPPESVEIVPVGKLDPGIENPGGIFVRLAFVPAKLPTKLLAPPVTLPAAVDGSIVPKFAPTKPPT